MVTFRMPRLLFILLCIVSLAKASAQGGELSVGIFTGLSLTQTWDEGIGMDQRYSVRQDPKFCPLGVSLEMDFQGMGYIISPGLIRLGQNFNVENTLGGMVGRRKIDLHYFYLPVGIKFHLIHTRQVRLSFVVSGGPAVLLQGSETVSHDAAKLNFPREVYPILPPAYTVEFDGVDSPEVSGYEMADAHAFNPLQFFGGLGFRSAWEVAKNWRVGLDVRAHYSFTDSRTDAHLDELKEYQAIYAIGGNRRDIFTQFSLGVTRYMALKLKKRKASFSSTSRSGKKKKRR